MTGRPAISLLWMLLLVGGVAGCAGSTEHRGAALGDPTSRPSAVRPAALGPPAPLLDFVATAAVGETTALVPTDGGRPLGVRFVAAYHSASGKTCRRLEVAEGEAPPVTRFACQDGFGVWRLLRPLQNRQLNGPGLADAGTSRSRARS